MQSQIESYRAKAREFARLAAIAKSRRDARHCRKLADMYWALALGDEPMRIQPRQMAPLPAATMSVRRAAYLARPPPERAATLRVARNETLHPGNVVPEKEHA
jgi:hypothetical protein